MELRFDKIQMILEEALIKEVTTTPKPGLVDMKDNGAHTDMTPELFIKSAKAISPYLMEMYQIAYTIEESPREIFHRIQKVGLRAEKAMFKATDGVNTHKGAIFNLGILSAAAGICCRRREHFVLEEILNLCREMTEEDIEIFFLELDQREAKTHGEELYKKYGERGIREQVALGFPVILEHSYPELCFLMEEKLDSDTIYVHTLLEIIAVLSDTNILSRSHGDYTQAEWMKHTARLVLREGGMLTKQGREHLAYWNEECIRRNLSPGGAADILVATIFLYNLIKFKGK